MLRERSVGEVDHVDIEMDPEPLQVFARQVFDRRARGFLRRT